MPCFSAVVLYFCGVTAFKECFMTDKQDSIPVRRPEIPDFDIPKGFATSDEYLRHLVTQGLKNQYPGKVNTVMPRAEHELDIITRLGYSDYFLIIADIVNWAREHNSLIGPGRGSAPSSIIAYTLGITSVDPLKYGLVFERFANLEHPALPDIDIDLSVDAYDFAGPDGIRNDKDAVVNYIIEKYGKDRVARMATHSIGKDGKKSVTGFHEAGLVISRNNLADYGKVYRDKKKYTLVKQYVLFEPEPCGLVRFDFLGLKTLDYLKSSEKAIRERGTRYSTFSFEKCGLVKSDFFNLQFIDDLNRCETGIREREAQLAGFSLMDIPLDDKVTFNLFSEGNTDNVFQFEDIEMKGILRKLSPGCFEHLIALSALRHPGFKEYLPEFIERRHGRKPVEYPLPCLEDILKETYGLIVYQEQLMQIAQRIAGYSLGQADVLRRHLLKASKTAQTTDAEKKQFITGAAAQGFTEQDAERIFEYLASAAGFVFSKSHAVGYSLLAYQAAYIKAYLPAGFS
jgi:DNA polymerase-3 subunit alpha